MSKLNFKFNKFLVALSGVLLAGGAALEDGDVSQKEALAVVGALVVAVGVYFTPNKQA